MKLAFRLGSIPVYVHGSFLLIVAVLGLNGGNLPQLLQWVVVVFVGVLLHELGHALVGRAFGLTPQIDLIGFGGLTSWPAGNARALRPGKRIAISLAGPFTGIAIGVATLVARAAAGLPPIPSPSSKTMLDSLTFDILWVNAGWGVLNLLPILPMDGGNVLFQVFNVFTKGRGERPARYVSLVVAVGIGLVGLVYRQTFAAMLAALFAMQNVQALRAGGASDREVPLRAVLKSGFDALDRGDPALGIRAANDVLARADDPALRTDALRLLAYGYLLTGAWGPLMEILDSPAAEAIGDEWMAKFEQAARELGRPEEASRIARVRAARPAAPHF